MEAPSNYKHNTPSNRKQTVKWLNEQTTFWHNFTDKCWYDDGYDEDDVNDIVCAIRDGIDQRTSKTLRDYIKSGSSLEDARHTKVPKWKPIDVLDPKEPKVTKANVIEHYINMPDVTRVIPKIMPFNPPKPRLRTVEEDCIDVEKWIATIEHVDNMEIIRTPESVKKLAKWIRQDEHMNYRSRDPISCDQVRDILKEFEK